MRATPTVPFPRPQSQLARSYMQNPSSKHCPSRSTAELAVMPRDTGGTTLIHTHRRCVYHKCIYINIVIYTYTISYIYNIQVSVHTHTPSYLFAQICPAKERVQSPVQSHSKSPAAQKHAENAMHVFLSSPSVTSNSRPLGVACGDAKATQTSMVTKHQMPSR